MCQELRDDGSFIWVLYSDTLVGWIAFSDVEFLGTYLVPLPNYRTQHMGKGKERGGEGGRKGGGEGKGIRHIPNPITKLQETIGTKFPSYNTIIRNKALGNAGFNFTMRNACQTPPSPPCTLDSVPIHCHV